MRCDAARLRGKILSSMLIVVRATRSIIAEAREFPSMLFVIADQPLHVIGKATATVCFYSFHIPLKHIRLPKRIAVCEEPRAHEITFGNVIR
jgi:hypothetical protein